ncbi:purine catabolism regulator [Nocardioides thalensis]|uniref:Purine catabolism regulator n=1 Tax=Nocardioides thalensis TaxID=1914755 RepID=A0A853C7G5_9ACTN|nr:PucR family transcriptional regulator [Nocardioides thalensis]NYJ03169.1 purine catabolism regulator [Nocardioides thalensis]
MAAPTVASLCSALGHHLSPAEGFAAPEREITGVHISELPDPNSYLTGGELLLTTGIALPTNKIGCRRYVARLREADISALAFGVGPVHDAIPDALADACRDQGLPLLVVPAPTPFLTISRAYWSAQARSTEQQLTDAVAAHRALVDAAAAPDAAAAILRRLARIVEGWAALLTADGAVDQIYPVGLADEAEVLEAEVARLEVAGHRSSASFTTDRHVVVVFPLAVESRIVGFLAAASPRRLEPAQRRVVLTAAALLSLDALRDQRAESAREAVRRCVAVLVDNGHVAAARSLAAETGAPRPRREVAVAALRGRDSEDLVRVVEQWCPDTLAVMVDRTTAWALLPDTHPATVELARRLVDADPSATAIVSELVSAESAGAVRARLLGRLGSLAAGTVELPRSTAPGATARALEEFAAAAGADLVDALVAFLRHRGHWEQAAAALGVHRNTLRYRVGKARALLGLDVDDPDVAAETWLALRARGLA